MAISASMATVGTLNLHQSATSTSSSPSSSLRLYSLHSRKFFGPLRPPTKFTLSSSRPPPPILPMVAAKNEVVSSFEEMLVNSDKPVLVDFYATWCGPCQFMVPILNEVSVSLIDKIHVVKVDTEKDPELADKYNIEALPTFILFKDGAPHDRFEGALTANQLIERIESSLEVKQ